MDARFIKAFTMPGETNLLGYRMRPFSLKHRLALLAIESPFVTPDKPMTVHDLFIAVKICAEKPIRRLTFMDMMRVSWISAKPSRFDVYVKAFYDHSNIAHWPKFWERNKQGGNSSGAPWVLNVVSSLIANGWEEEAAWSLPESQAIWYHTALSINNGNDVSLMSDDQEDIIANFDKFVAEAKAKPRIYKKQKATK